jgi:hypothetical protein
MTTTKQCTRRAEALFASALQPSDQPAPEQVRAAIVTSLRTYGGASGCVATMAAEFGEHPEQAARRMRWALELVSGATVKQGAAGGRAQSVTRGVARATTSAARPQGRP